MFKKIVSLALTAALSVSLVACGGAKETADQQTSSDSAAPAQETEAAPEAEFDGNFVVGFDAEFPPFGFMDDNGEYVGFDLDLAQEVCDRNGWTLTKQPIDWDAKDMELDSGTISCIWNGFTYNGRENDYTWTVPYVDSSIVVCTRADSEINSLADLAGKIVMVQKDSSGLAALEENEELTSTFGELQEIADYNSAFMNLESGAVDAVVVDNAVGNKQMKSKEGVFKMLTEEVNIEQYAVGFKNGNTSLRDMVQATLFEMVDDGTFDEIAARWADDDIPDMICLADQPR